MKKLEKYALSFFRKNQKKSYNYKQVAAALELKSPEDRNHLIVVLNEMAKRDILTEESRGKFKLNYSGAEIEGIVDMTTSGAAFIINEHTEEDIYVSPKNVGNTLHGDKVKVQLVGQRRGKNHEGEILEILERRKTEFVGFVEVSDKFAFLVPDDPKIHIDIFVPLDKLKNAKHGDKAIAEITDWPKRRKNPNGEITEVLGAPGNNEVEMASIMIDHDIARKFPTSVEKEADQIDFEIPEEEIRKRKDLREITTFTIDPVNAQDFDDALSLQKLENGNWEVGIHIADVSHYVVPGSSIDHEARKRATSVYLVDRVIPMLPEKLSNGVCSLRPEEEKLAYSAVFELTDKAVVKNQWFGRTVIKSDRRFSYEEVQEVIETGNGEYKEEIMVLNDLAIKLRNKRFKNGSIGFERAEPRFKLDKHGKPLDVVFKVAKESNKLIEDFMLLANRSIAEFIGKKIESKGAKAKELFVYRVHDSPDIDKLTEFARFIKNFDYSINLVSPHKIRESMNRLLEEVKGKGEQNVIEQLAIRTMAKALYSTINIGHYGLAFEYYTHFTSPIRRYPDVLVHRILDAFLTGKPEQGMGNLEELCKHCSDMEKKAAEAERDSVKYKQVEFFMDKVGQEYDGLISGVTEWGIYVEILENKCEGMIRLNDMEDDHYYFDERNFCIAGHRTKAKYRLGDEIRIVVKSADLSRKQLNFILAG